MQSFDKSIGLRIVATDADVSNVILLGKIVESCDEGKTVVGYDFGK
jgi:hypothetical protein